MTADAWLTLIVVVAVLVLLARDLAPAPFVLMGSVVMLLAAGVIGAEEAFAGFSNPAPITVAALYVLAGAVQQTGVLESAVGRLLGSGGATRQLLARITVPTAAASAFLNNTPIVAMLAPAVSAWANQRRLPVSRFLMPVSYAAVFGGTVSAIGTSTNLVVSGLLVDSGRPPLGLFELTVVGLPLAVTGVALLVVLSPLLLPDRADARESFVEHAREFTVAMEVVPGGSLDGRSLEEGGLRSLEGVYCVRLSRGPRVIAPVAPEEVLRGDDELLFVGNVDRIVDLQRNRGLRSAEADQVNRLGSNGQLFYEAVIGPDSSLVGRTLKAGGFRGRHGAAVLAIHRAGQRLEGKLGEIELRSGDTLLLLADHDFQRRWRESQDFLLVAGTGQAPPLDARRARVTGAVALALVVLAGLGVVPILEASLVAAVALVALRVLTPGQARAAVDVNVLVVIAAAFGLGAAVEASGLGGVVANGLLAVTAPLGAIGALAGVLLVTMILTEMLSNNAAAVLAFPVALATAAEIGADLRPFAIAIAIGASLSFLTPIGYQTNLMVYGIGGYRFGDFARLGAPLTATVVVGSLVLIPLAWPL